MTKSLPFKFNKLLLCLSAISFSGATLAQDEPLSPKNTAQTLPTIFVSAAGYEQEIKNAPASVSVIDSESLENQKTTSITDALSSVEGIDVGSSAGKTGGMNISMRGMPSDYTLILIDGHRQNTAGNVTPNGFGETSTSFLPPIQAIERIEVIRGPMSTLYGSDAMGGVVNIITKKVASSWQGAIGVNSTTQQHRDFGDQYGSNLYLSGPLIQDTLGLSLRGTLSHRQASELTANNDVVVSRRGPSPVKNKIYSGGARLTFTPNENHEIWLDADISRQAYDNSDAQLGTIGVRGYEKAMHFNRSQFLATHNWNNDLGQLETSLTYNQTETIGRTIPAGIVSATPGSSRELKTENIIADIKMITDVMDSHTATFGGQFWHANMHDGLVTSKFEQNQWAVFGEDDWNLSDDVTLTYGARYDRHDKFGHHISPRVYGVWNATPDWTIKGGYSEGFKTPRLDQTSDSIVGFTWQGTVPLIGTPTLQPEKSQSLELGANYTNHDGFQVGTTLFYNRFKDKIANGDGLFNCSYSSSPNRPGCVDYGYWPNADTFNQLVNVDKAETKGIEASIRIPLMQNWALSGNYTYTRSEQKSGVNNGEPLYNTPKHMFNSTLDWQTTSKLKTWLKYEYRSERWRSSELIREQIGNYKGYSLFHLGGTYEWSQNLKISAIVYNLLDKDFLDYHPYQTTAGVTEYSSAYSNAIEGRRLWLSGVYTF